MTSRSRTIIIIVALLAVLPALAAVSFLAGLRINLTPSYPLGIWRIEALEREVVRGDRVFICPPLTPVFVTAHERGYLSRGLCPGWLSPLIKRVIAVAGQHVLIQDDITVDGVPVENSCIRTTDAEGRGLVPNRGGSVPIGHVFIFSDFPGSYDSRYFGPVPANGVLGLAHPVLVFTF